MKKFVIKKFTVYEMNAMECGMVLKGFGVCDYCNNQKFKGYYIPVLNRWYCENCYKRFISRAKYYEEDRDFEARYIEFVDKIVEKYYPELLEGEK